MNLNQDYAMIELGQYHTLFGKQSFMFQSYSLRYSNCLLYLTKSYFSTSSIAYLTYKAKMIKKTKPLSFVT